MFSAIELSVLGQGRDAPATCVGLDSTRERGAASTGRLCVDSGHLSVSNDLTRSQRGTASRGLGQDVDGAIE